MRGCCIGSRGCRRAGSGSGYHILHGKSLSSSKTDARWNRAVSYIVTTKSRPFSERKKDGFFILYGLLRLAECAPFWIVGQIARALSEELCLVAIAVQGRDGGYALFVAASDIEGRVSHHDH